VDHQANGCGPLVENCWFIQCLAVTQHSEPWLLTIDVERYYIRPVCKFCCDLKYQLYRSAVTLYDVRVDFWTLVNDTDVRLKSISECDSTCERFFTDASSRFNMCWSVYSLLQCSSICNWTDAPWCEVKPTHAGFKHVTTNFPSRKKEKFEENCYVKGRNEPSCIVWVVHQLPFEFL